MWEVRSPVGAIGMFFLVASIFAVNATAQDQGRRSYASLRGNDVSLGSGQEHQEAEGDGEEASPAALNRVISLRLDGATLEEALERIAAKSDLNLVYGSQKVAVGKTLTLALREVSVRAALEEVLRGTGLRTRVLSGGQVVVVDRQEREPNVRDVGSTSVRESLSRVEKLSLVRAHPQEPHVQTGTISGTVTDAESGEPLPGVNVMIMGTTQGAATGPQGQFTISDVEVGTYELQASFVGYEEVTRSGVEVNEGETTTVDFALQTSAQLMEDLVVVGYGTQQEADVTGAVSSVNSEDLTSVANNSINNMLQGKAPGLNLRVRSAQPGGGVTANVRGAISPNGNNSPLYVIDGVPITNNSSTVPGLNNSDLGFYGGIDRDPLSYLNPSDIESVTVLKDASATAIYGSSAANGVVLITTKEGREGSLTADYQGSYTRQTPQDYFPLLDGQEFMRQQKRLARDRHLFNNRIGPYGDTDPSTVPDYNPLFSEDQISSAEEGTDWPGFIMENGYIHEHSVSVRGGGDNTTFYTSLNYRNNDAILRHSDLTEYSGRINLEHDLSEAINLNLKMTASQMNSVNASTGENDGGQEKYNMIQAAMTYAPTVGQRNDEGAYADTYDPLIMNPAAFLSLTDDSKTQHLLAVPTVEVDFTETLTGRVQGQADLASTDRGFYLPREANNAQLPDGAAQKSHNSTNNYTTEAYLTYQNTFESSSLEIVAGGGVYKTTNEGFDLQGVGYFTDAFLDNNVEVAENTERTQINSWRSERTKLSQFARANYSLFDKYNFSLSARRDGSSIFAEDQKYGIFPGGSAAWRISEEGFMESVSAVSNLKLRASYGVAGNESVLSGNTLELYTPGYPAYIGGTQINGVSLSQVANENLTWESVYTLNVGLDFGFWSDRMSGSFDYFVKTARDLLDFNPLPSSSPVGLVADNVGATRSKGFEVALETQNVAADNFQWTTDINVSRHRNYWIERNPRVSLPSYVDEQDPINAIYGWETNGIIQGPDDVPEHMPDAFPGNIQYVDQNGDGELDGEDVVQLGTWEPDWTVGLTNRFSYGNFNLRVYLYGNFGYKAQNNFAPDVFTISQNTNPSNTTAMVQDAWSAENTDGTIPGVADNPYAGDNPTQTNDFYLQKAGFVRVKNVSLSYSIPTSLFGGSQVVQNARVFASVEDLGVFSDYSGFDPEYTEPNPYPKSRSTTIGLDVTF